MRVGRVLAVLATVAVAASVTASVAPAGAQSGSVPGVSKKEIKVGGIVGKTNPTGRPYEAAAVGAKAYFDMVNKKGGVHGRKFKMVAVLDDQTRDSKNLLNARSLVEEKKVFAIVPMATQTFASASYLAEKGVPTFGWNIQADWAKGPSLFGEKGSWLCFGTGCFSMAPNYIAQQEKAKAAGTLAYGSSPQSSDCSKAIESTFARWGPKVAVADRSLSFGFSANDISAAVQAVKENGVDFIAPCMDVNGAVNFQKALKQAGITNVKWYAPEGYDEDIIADLGDDQVEGFVFAIAFVPFDQAKHSKGMQQFLKAMKARGETPNEQGLSGWQGAMLLHEGIKRAGKDFTRESVVAEINKITDWTANGTRAPVNWTTAHGPTPPNSLSCTAYTKVKNGKFETVYAPEGKPFVCHPQNPWPETLDKPIFLAPGETRPNGG